MGVTKLKLEQIRIDGGTQPRASIDWHTVTTYAEDMAEGHAFPPVVVFYDGTDYWMADGFHRFNAAEQNDQTSIAAEVRMGTRQDAKDYACSDQANAKHGLREKKEDRWRRVAEMVKDHPDWSLREVAAHCGVSHDTVKRVRESICKNLTDSGMSQDIASPARTVTRNGTTYTQNTANIGKSKGSTVRLVNDGDDDPADDTTTIIIDRDTGEELDGAAVVTTRIHVPPKPRNVPEMASDAMQFASIAISQLERIRYDDPRRTEALRSVARWISENGG